MSLTILNVGEGDTRITFDKDKPGELERARRVVMDMLRLGYAILVQVGQTKDGKPKFRRAHKFDPDHDEYIVSDLPSRVPATTPAVAVARSAGGMSTAADSIEAKHKLEQFDNFAPTRNRLRELAAMRDQWAGLPMPLNDLDLVLDPCYPHAAAYKTFEMPVEVPVEVQVDAADDPYAGAVCRSRFHSVHKRRDVVIFELPSGKILWGLDGLMHHWDVQVQTMTASLAWGIEQEANAVQLLGTLLPHHAFKSYLLTGMFVECSERSGVYYFFRRLRPTVAASGSTGKMKILAVLCQHPIAYYSGTWAGAMCPTDDVIAHLMLMRGDEKLYWRRCNQHRPHEPNAGI